MEHTFQPTPPSRLYDFICWCARWLWFWPLGGIEALHTERIPREGPTLVCPNHVSNVDPPAMAVTITRGLNSMGKAELFRIPIFGWVIRAVGCFPVKRGVGDSEAIRYALEVLGKGGALLVFPEGTRNDGRHMRPISAGVGMMAKRSGAQVVPVAIIGTHVQMPKGRLFPRRTRVRVVYGTPFTYAEIAVGDNERQNRERFAQELANRISALANQHGMMLTTAEAKSSEDGSRAPEIATGPTDPEPAESPTRP